MGIDIDELKRIKSKLAGDITTPVRVIVERLEKNPARYLEYGAYWYEVKRVLRENGHNYGDYFDLSVQEHYKGVNDIETLILADMFRQIYRSKYFEGNRDFTLDNEQPYSLLDPDMENLIIAMNM